MTFDEAGAIARMETDGFLMEGNGIMQREVGSKLDYEKRDGFRVPTRMDYRWYLEDGTLSSHYAFEVRDVSIRGEAPRWHPGTRPPASRRRRATAGDR